MKNKQFIFMFSLFFTFLCSCSQEADKQKKTAKKAQDPFEKLMPKSKEELKGSYKSVAKPDFLAIKDTKAKKQAFVSFMLPMIRESNRLILKDRKKLITALVNKKDTAQEPLQDAGLLKLCNRYTKDCKKGSAKDKLAELLKRANIVPASLVLAQAANESAWGTSRFATDANNFFGQWCFSKGCGLVPQRRGDTQTHEVRKFSSSLASVKSYMRNINTGHAYTQLREIRADLLAKKQPIRGVALAAGLMKYSERGQDYIDEVRQMIRYNQFDRYDLY